MTQILHIVGQQGSGKSTLARQIQTALVSRKQSCVNLTEIGLHEPGAKTDIEHLRTHGVRLPYASHHMKPDVMVVEHLYRPHPSELRSGDLVIHLERVA